jgi:hypothetical protein
MHWTIAAPFTTDPKIQRWLVPYVPGNRHSFSLVPAQGRASWHNRNAYTAGAEEWMSAWKQGTAAWRDSQGGIVTVFPHLAAAVGLRSYLSFQKKPIVAWCFNLGATYGGIKRQVARLALGNINRFIVHSRAEADRYADWLGIARERFMFVPLQRPAIPLQAEEDVAQPFVLAMGSAKRDYRSFFEAVRDLGYKTVVVAARHAVAGLTVPANVELRSGLSPKECILLGQRARISVIPVDNENTASGQVTILEAMRMGRPVVATRCIGSEDYVRHEETGLLVPAHDVGELRTAIQRLWDDQGLRGKLGKNAAQWAAEHCSDEAIGPILARVLDEVEASSS